MNNLKINFNYKLIINLIVIMIMNKIYSLTFKNSFLKIIIIILIIKLDINNKNINNNNNNNNIINKKKNFKLKKILV